MRKAEREAEKKIVPKPDDLPQHYDLAVLEVGRQYELATGRYPFNPDALNADSLALVNLDWINDYERYKEAVAFEVDKLKRSGG